MSGDAAPAAAPLADPAAPVRKDLIGPLGPDQGAAAPTPETRRAETPDGRTVPVREISGREVPGREIPTAAGPAAETAAAQTADAATAARRDAAGPSTDAFGAGDPAKPAATVTAGQAEQTLAETPPPSKAPERPGAGEARRDASAQPTSDERLSPSSPPNATAPSAPTTKDPLGEPIAADAQPDALQKARADRAAETVDPIRGAIERLGVEAPRRVAETATSALGVADAARAKAQALDAPWASAGGAAFAAALEEQAALGGGLGPSLGGGASAASGLAPASAPAAANAAPAVLASAQAAAQVSVAIAAQRENGVIELRLDPPELGRVRLELRFDGADTVSVTLQAERPETLDLLRRQADQLGRELIAAGLSLDGLDFGDAAGFGAEDGRSAADGGAGDASAARPTADTAPDRSNATLHARLPLGGPGPMVGASARGLDLRI
ncbi:MAG: flagellar hook-length control protein FliK [Pseudomonadota bacterium]